LNRLRTQWDEASALNCGAFGVFSVRPRKTGIGRNPRTGEEVNIPPEKRFDLNRAKSCRDSKAEPTAGQRSPFQFSNDNSEP